MQVVSPFLTDRKLNDLNPLIVGEEVCNSGHSFGPAVRKYTLIHYVLHGKGTFYARGGVHQVSAGQAFVILPGEVTTYTADIEDPWYYRWIGFDGALAGRFEELPPVINVPKMFFDRIMRLAVRSETAEYLLAGELFSLYAYLFTDNHRGNSHVHRVENYIRSNYMYPIYVEEIAKTLNLDRRYLSRIFKEQMGLSIQDFLIRVRMEEAESLLLKGYKVKEVAQLWWSIRRSIFPSRCWKAMGSMPGEATSTVTMMSPSSASSLANPSWSH